MKLDRENDLVYRDTMNVVKAAIQSNQQIMGSNADDIFVLVKVSNPTFYIIDINFKHFEKL